MTDNDPAAGMFRAALEEMISTMPADQFRALVARTRPLGESQLPADDVAHRHHRLNSSMAAKTTQLWDITQASGPNRNQGLADAAAVFQQPAQPAPQPGEPTAPPGFTSNRGQAGAGSSEWAPVNERDRNRAAISDILAKGHPAP